MSAAPEFSRPVSLARLGAEPFRREIVATEAERAALARRFGLVALDRLCATIELVRRSERLILLRATFEAEFAQECVVTLDPVPGVMAQEFALLYGPPDLEESAMGVVGDTVAFEPLTTGAIDVGEAVAQEFSLALPPFPRSPDADVAEVGEIESPLDDTVPFAALRRLLDRRGGGT